MKRTGCEEEVTKPLHPADAERIRVWRQIYYVSILKVQWGKESTRPVGRRLVGEVE